MNNKIDADIIIYNGQVLTINDRMEVIENGVVVIKEGRILGVGESNLTTKYKAPKMIDADGGIVMPGMINSHGHLPMIAFRSLGEEGIENRLMGYFLPLEKKMLSQKLVHDATVFGAMDMALSGVTTYVDMYYHIDEMAKATHKIGLRAILGQSIVDFPVSDADKPYGGLDLVENMRKELDKYSLISLSLAPHAPYTVCKEKLQEVKSISDKTGLPIHIHAAEFASEKDQIADNDKGLSVIGYLDSIGFLGDKVCLAHCNYVNDEDLNIIKQRNSTIAHNPMANAKGATGMAPIVEALEKNIAVGLGTDGPMGSNVIGLFRAMIYSSTIQRIRKWDRTLMPPKQVVKLATLGGARAIGMDDKIGSIEEGKRGDIIIVERNSLNMIPSYDPYATLVFQAAPQNVQTTLVDGKIIVENRKVKTFDVEEAKDNMKKWMPDIAAYGKLLAEEVKNTKSKL